MVWIRGIVRYSRDYVLVDSAYFNMERMSYKVDKLEEDREQG